MNPVVQPFQGGFAFGSPEPRALSLAFGRRLSLNTMQRFVSGVFHENRELNAHIGRALEVFKEKYPGACPECVAVAPGRVNLIGEHTDYQEGFVFPMAINKYTLVAAGWAPAGELHVFSELIGEAKSWSLQNKGTGAGMDPLPTSPSEDKTGWYSYVLGVVHLYLEAIRKEKLLTLADVGFRLVITSTLRMGAGLSSSASLEVAVATALEKLTKIAMPPVYVGKEGFPSGADPMLLSAMNKALLCQQAEHQWAKVPCGIMDQTIVCMASPGEATLLDCRSLQMDAYPLPLEEVSILVVHCGVRHKLVDGEYKKRKDALESVVGVAKETDPHVASLRDMTEAHLDALRTSLTDEQYKRALHVIRENRRCLAFGEHLKGRRYAEAGRIMYEGHESLRDNFEVTVKQSDLLVDLCRSIEGVYGARMTGAGFGGCVVVLVETRHATSVLERLLQTYTPKYSEWRREEIDAALSAGVQSGTSYVQPDGFIAVPVGSVIVVEDLE